MSKVWLVTGCSRGLGQLLVKTLLNRGYRVIATSRTKESLTKVFGEKSNIFLPVALDLNNNEQIKAVIAEAVAHFGSIDCLVNNAGYLRSGAIEEVSDQEARDSYDINVFGALNMIRHVLPVMRQQHSGHILNTSSIAGTIVYPLGSTYSGAKFSINAISYALYNEVKAFNIKVTNLVLGYFRTDFLNEGSYQLSYKEGPYSSLNEKHLKSIQATNHQQIGDPQKAVNAYIDLFENDNPPKELVLGVDAYDMLKKAYETKLKELEDNKHITLSTYFDE